MVMKTFLGIFGVEESEDLSPFCCEIKDTEYLIILVKNYMPGSGEVDMTNQEVNNNETEENNSDLNAETLKSFVSLLQQNDLGEEFSKIKGDEAITGSDEDEGSKTETGTEEKENFHNCSETASVYTSFKNIILNSDLFELAALSLEGIGKLEMKKIDVGSTSKDRKVKSLEQRWFTKDKQID